MEPYCRSPVGRAHGVRASAYYGDTITPTHMPENRGFSNASTSIPAYRSYDTARLHVEGGRKLISPSHAGPQEHQLRQLVTGAAGPCYELLLLLFGAQNECKDPHSRNYVLGPATCTFQICRHRVGLTEGVFSFLNFGADLILVSSLNVGFDISYTGVISKHTLHKLNQ